MVLFRNKHDRTFEDVSKAAGFENLRSASWRGLAVGDINNDGKLDILVMDADGPPLLLLNKTESKNHSVLFRLVGTTSNKAAIGARVIVDTGDFQQTSEVQSGSSYLSQNDLRLHFGLGTHTNIKRVQILWPSGRKEVFSDLPADNIYSIVEGHGLQQKAPFQK